MTWIKGSKINQEPISLQKVVTGYSILHLLIPVKVLIEFMVVDNHSPFANASYFYCGRIDIPSRLANIEHFFLQNLTRFQ